MPRWVRVSALVAAVLVALAIVVMVASGGEHGPSRHSKGQSPDGAIALALRLDTPVQ
jgi:hypothetical protein